jgi:hypothetical protein
METVVGGILNKFKIKSRRSTFFFEDILANYIKECEDAGYGEEMKEIAQKWAILCTQQLTPTGLKKLSPSIYFNVVAKNVWTNIGLMDFIHATKNGSIIKIETKNESITRIIEKNSFPVGFFTGILNVLFKSQIEHISKTQTKESCEYIFKIMNKPFGIISAKEKRVYDSLNYLLTIEGFTLKDALKKNILELKKMNKIYFRGKIIFPIENTVFHIIGNKSILLEKVPFISHKYFDEIIKKDTTKERKLALLKTLLQVMGWGIVEILIKNKKEIVVEIKNLPYGLQVEKNDWEFLIGTILGYLWLLDKNLEITNIKEAYKKLIITYSTHHKH